MTRGFILLTYRLRGSLERKHSFKIQDSVCIEWSFLLTKFISFSLMASNEFGGRVYCNNSSYEIFRVHTSNEIVYPKRLFLKEFTCPLSIAIAQLETSSA